MDITWKAFLQIKHMPHRDKGSNPSAALSIPTSQSPYGSYDSVEGRVALKYRGIYQNNASVPVNAALNYGYKPSNK
jgi:hypothetical protein